jgi:phasin family protein
MTPSQSGRISEENNPMDPIEQAARASERTASEFAEGASRAKDAAARASDQAMRAGVEMIQRNAETVQHTLQCGAKLAARMSERCADQFGLAVGFSGEGAQRAAQRSSRNLEVIVQSGTVLTEITQRLSEEWAEMARARMDRGFDRLNAFLQCRTPQDFAALQSEVLRDNIETFLGYARKVGEHSARLAEEARQRSGTAAESRRAA